MVLLTRKELAIILEKVQPLKKPKISLEQYTIPSELAATILHIVNFTYDDIKDKIICDLGCGSGRFAIGAALLGAKVVYAVDIDNDAIQLAKENAKKIGVKNIIFIRSDIRKLEELTCDVVIMNPPFGTKKRHSDIIFLEKAMQIGDIIYSLHKSGEEIRRFITSFVKSKGRNVDVILKFVFEIPHMFEHHRKTKYRFLVDLYRIL